MKIRIATNVLRNRTNRSETQLDAFSSSIADFRSNVDICDVHSTFAKSSFMNLEFYSVYFVTIECSKISIRWESQFAIKLDIFHENIVPTSAVECLNVSILSQLRDRRSVMSFWVSWMGWFKNQRNYFTAGGAIRLINV